MNVILPKNQLKKRQVQQSFFTLLIFFASFFAHSEHFAQIEFDALSIFEQHDCHLCQQGVDSPSDLLALKWVKEDVSFIACTQHSSVLLSPVYYLYPLLRAPPT